MPNIICLVVDRLRAAALGCYGAAWCETPALDRLAAESFVFDHFLVDRPELESLYRGYWQGWHALAPAALADELPTLPGVLSAQQFATVLVTDEAAVAEHSLAEDFSERVRVAVAPASAAAGSIDETQLAQFFAEALDCLAELSRPRQQPFFCWLHARGMAGPWDAPYELRASLAEEDDPPPPRSIDVPSRTLMGKIDPDEVLGVTQAYTGQVMALDECVAALCEQLAATGLAKTTLLILMGARGFPLGEHGRVGEADEALYGELIHVPILIRFPDGVGQLARSQALVQPADLPATLAAWLGVEFAAPHGANVLPMVRGETDVVRDRACLVSTDDSAIRTPGWHLRVPDAGEPELFVKPDDRWEANEISSRCREVVSGLKAALAETRQSLQSLPPRALPALDQLLTEPAD